MRVGAKSDRAKNVPNEADQSAIAGASFFEDGGELMNTNSKRPTSVGAFAGVENCCVLTIENDAKRNALSLDVLKSLRQDLVAALDHSPRAIVIASHGTVFSAGHDFRELVDPQVEDMQVLFGECAALISAIRAAPCPVISRVQGAAIGAGCLLALECDFVVASQQASFQTPGGARGWFCFTPMLALIERTTLKRALEMLMCGDKISAQQALDWGLVNRVVSPDQLDTHLTSFVAKLTSGSAEMIAEGKSAFYKLSELSFEERLARATELMITTVSHPDAQKRIAGFIKP